MNPPNLQELLNGYREHNIRPSFDFRPYTDLPIFGSSNTQEIAILTEKIKAEADAANKTLYVLPVHSWYREKDGGRFEKKDQSASAAQFSAWSEIPILNSVTKVNYTANTYHSFGSSYFIGNIPSHSHIIILDDLIDSGRTFRDMARFIDHSSATIAGYCVTDFGNACGHSFPTHLNNLDKCFAAILGCLNGVNRQKEALVAYKNLSDSEKTAFVERCRIALDPALEAYGLSLAQIMQQELSGLLGGAAYLGRILQEGTFLNSKTSIEDTINKTRYEPVSVPQAEAVHKPQELTEFIIRTRTTPKEFIQWGNVSRLR